MTRKAIVPMLIKIIARTSVFTILSFSTIADIIALKNIDIALEHPKNI
jgi:hypothetical protein